MWFSNSFKVNKKPVIVELIILKKATNATPMIVKFLVTRR